MAIVELNSDFLPPSGLRVVVNHINLTFALLQILGLAILVLIYNGFQIPEENIIDSRNKQFDVELLLKTNGKGFKIVVNTLPEPESIKSLANLTGLEGRLFQVSVPVFEEDEKIGMS